MLQYFTNHNELNVRNLTEVIYTGSKILAYKFPRVMSLIPEERILNTLLVYGAISPKEHAIAQIFRRQGTMSLIPNLAKLIQQQLNETLNPDLIASYLSAIVIMSSEHLKITYFQTDMADIGAIDEATDYRSDYEKRLAYKNSFKYVPDGDWKRLESIYV